MKKSTWILVCSLAACASYQKRQECEKENWFQYGFDVAMSGKRLNGDPKILECRQVSAHVDEGQLDLGFKAGMEKYCQPEVVLGLGKQGEFFNPEFCYPSKVPALRLKHEAGLKQFCQKSNGYGVGVSGYVYKQICSAELEPAFLPEYRRGRKKFLTARIEQGQHHKLEVTEAIARVERAKHSLEMERAFLVGRRVLVRERVFDADSQQYRESEHWEDDPAAAQRRWTLDTEISYKDAERAKLQKESDAESAQIAKDQSELEALSD